MLPRKLPSLRQALRVSVLGIGIALLSCDEPIPPYTPSPSDLDEAYAKAAADVSSAIPVFHRFKSEAANKLEKLPDLTLGAVQQAAACDVSIDSLGSDPRVFLRSPLADLASQDLADARNAPRIAAHDLAAAHVASPANRGAVDAALSEYQRASIGGGSPNASPVLQGYLDFLSNDAAFQTYLDDINTIHESYFPAERRLKQVMDGLLVRFLEALGSDCTARLYAQYEAYMKAFANYGPALLSYYDGYIEAATQYRDAIKEAR